jgi:dihydropteroate synthase
MESPHILRARDLVLDCRIPIPQGAHVMGVLNVTPDSFSDGGLYLDVQKAVRRAHEMAAEGARLIDIGGASSRPKGATYGAGAALVSADEEMARILPVIEQIAARLPGVWISVDTFRADVAQAALSAGAHMINDITALRFDPHLAAVCAEADAPLVLMHSVGLPGDMPHVVECSDVVETVRQELREALQTARNAGCRHVVLDPGFGFGKTHADNFRLMGGVGTLLAEDVPVLVGVSRKSSIGWAARNREADPIPPPGERLPGSLAAAGVAVQRGASIVRTHDVAATVQYLRVQRWALNP